MFFILSLTFTGSALNSADSEEILSTTQAGGSLTNETNDKETVTQEKKTPYATKSIVSSGNSNGGTSMYVFPTQIVTIKQFPTSISAKKGSTTYPKYPDNGAGASSNSSSSDGNFIEINSDLTRKVTLPFTTEYLQRRHSNDQEITGIPNRRSLSPNNTTTIESNAQQMVKMPGAHNIGIITSVSVVMLVIIALSIGFVCRRHYLQRSIKSDRHEQLSIELHNIESVLPGIPDNQIGADEIYEQINPDEHYYSTITETGPTVAPPSQSASTLGSPISIYVLNATCCDEQDV